MAKRTPGKKSIFTKHTPPPGWKNPLAPQQPLTAARWVVLAFASMLLLSLFCVYITFCLLFWQGQWQLVFHPTRAIPTTPAAAQLPFDDVPFDATEAGVLQLHGWWVPATLPSADTMLVMHDGSGSLSDAVPQLAALHPLGSNLFAFDYRGFGKSVSLHPSEASTYEDAEAAWHYLTETRHVAPETIILDGVGLGAAVAIELARRHPEARALIIERPVPPVLETLHFNKLTRLLPVRWLFHDRFDPRASLSKLTMPKLFFYSPADTTGRYYIDAAEPKQKAMLTSGYNSSEFAVRFKDFLSKYPARP